MRKIMKNGKLTIDNGAGNEEFWRVFFALYLNRNQLPLIQAYRLAVVKIKKENPFAVIPRIGQARYQVSKIHPAEIVSARYGEKPLRKSFHEYIKRDYSKFKLTKKNLAALRKNHSIAANAKLKTIERAVKAHEQTPHTTNLSHGCSHD